MNAQKHYLCSNCGDPDCSRHSDVTEVVLKCGCCQEPFTDRELADRCCSSLVDRSDIRYGRQKPSAIPEPPSRPMYKRRPVGTF
jgi:hypothetical protein